MILFDWQLANYPVRSGFAMNLECPKFGRGILSGLLVAILTILPASGVQAQSANALKACVALSDVNDNIHACMDNYLNSMDNNIADMEAFLTDSLTGEALLGLERSQTAFAEYRRQNCLWYLEFSSPRSEAELIAKNCLANMSRQRWQELQGLIGEGKTSIQTVSGFYVYGAGRNSVQLCGSEERYWLGGDPSVVNDAQQLYLTLASSEFQVLHAVFSGSLDESSSAPEGHSAVFNASALVDMSVPTESDCRLPGKVSAFDLDAEVNQSAFTPAEEIADEDEQDEPQQQLIAYFGAWLVDCTERNGRRTCNLSVDLNKAGSKDDINGGTLMVVREKGQKTRLELIFPEREIDSPSLIRWRIDAFAFGDLIGSSILVDEKSARQLIPSDRFLDKELLPMMIGGVDLSIEILQQVDDASGEEFLGTLNGLTKALAFSDDFVRDSTE